MQAARSASPRRCCRRSARLLTSREVRDEYLKIATAHAKAQADKQRLTLTAARANGLKVDWKASKPPVKPSFIGLKSFDNYSLAELVEFIDWTPFFQTWELSGRYPNILDDPKQGEAARALFDDAQAMLKQIVDEKWFTAKR
jgi:5-methyltetrahydrofolate--homocysteine methyltransferase